MAEQEEKITGRELWLYGIGALIALAVVLLLLIALLNAGTILVGIVLTIFQVAFSLVIVAVFVILLLWILKVIGDAEGRIKKDLESLRKTFLQATYKFGADFLSFVNALLTYLIQEAVADYPRLYKISICVLFTLDFFLASQLIGSAKRSDKIVGIIFFVSPIVLFSITVLALVSPQAVLSWFHKRSMIEIILISSVFMSILLTFLLAFLKRREV